MLQTARLTLRAFRLDDAPAVQDLASDRAIADTTLNIPHPYEDGMAQAWIETHEPAYADGTDVTFAIVRTSDETLVGAIGLRLERRFNKGEVGYWIGKPHWNQGYATEATTAILEWGFEDLELNRIHAWHVARNPASGRVMQKAGMQLEGTARQATMKWGKYEDLVSYAILREDWAAGD